MPVSTLRLQLISGLIITLCSTVLYAGYDVSALKKVFTDKNQRAQIDTERSGNPAAGKLKKSSRINVTGYVTRSDGKSVVWLNNRNTLESATLGDIKVHQSSVGKNKTVTISVDGKYKKLKPGETWLKATGKVVDNY